MKLGNSNVVILCCCLALCFPSKARAQYGVSETTETKEIYQSGIKYIRINLHRYEKLLNRAEKQQHCILRKLKIREEKVIAKIAKNDSFTLAKLNSQPLTYDSISKMLPGKSANPTKVESVLDTLKGVKDYLANSTSYAANDLEKYNSEIAELQKKLNYQQYISDLISNRKKQLESLPNIDKSCINGISKELAYYKMKIAAWKEIADDPNKTEQKAFEILQGTKGFSNFLNKSTKGENSGLSCTNLSELSTLGFQTKSSTNKLLQDRIGNNMNQVQEKISGQLDDYKNKVQDLSNQAKELKQTAKDLDLQKPPAMRLNPMRGKPFLLRFEKQFGFTTTKSNAFTPAMLSLNGGVGYRQNQKLSTGILAIGNIGLGTSWNNINISMQGIGLSAYIRWQLIYGIGFYSSYERCWKQNVFTNNRDASSLPNYSVHNTQAYTESFYLGMEKLYRISKKVKGSIQLLYDLYWFDKGLASPFQIKIVTIK
jgi:hypothetical protein